MILSQNQDNGTAIKSEDEDQTKNTNVDVFGFCSMVPITFYCNGDGTNNDLASKQLFDCLKEKINKYLRKKNRN